MPWSSKARLDIFITAAAKYVAGSRKCSENDAELKFYTAWYTACRTLHVFQNAALSMAVINAKASRAVNPLGFCRANSQ